MHYIFMHGLYLRAMSVRAKQMPKSQQDGDWCFSAAFQRTLSLYLWTELCDFVCEAAQIDAGIKTHKMKR